jgi:hypothetical protein
MKFVERFILFPMQSQSPRLRLAAGILIFLASAFISWTMFSISLQSQWSLIDDHEIAYFLGNDQKITLPQAWTIYTRETEIGKFGLYGRFRPAYYAFRLLETWIWNDELIFWFVSNLLIFSAFISVFWYLAAELIGFGIAGLLSVYMATALYWIDVFDRLGPSEPYAALGMSIAALGVYLLYRHKRKGWGWFLFSSGLMICTGSKENFFPFLIPFVWILWDQSRRQKIVFWIWLMLGVVVIWNSWIISAILLALGPTGKDVYQSSITDKLLFTIAALRRFDVIILILMCLFFAGAWLVWRKKSQDLSGPALSAGASALFLLLLYLSQFLIYGGDFPNGDRYDLPGMLVWPAAIILMVWFIQRMIGLDKNNRNHRIILIVIMLVAGGLVVSHRDGFETAQAKSRKHVKESRKFTRDIEKLASLAESGPDYAIAFQASNALFDYEALFSYNQFLRYYGVTNPMAILWAGGDVPEGDMLYPYYLNLSTLSSEGMAALPDLPLGADFVPLADIESYGTRCILVIFSTAPPAKECNVIFEIAH